MPQPNNSRYLRECWVQYWGCIALRPAVRAGSNGRRDVLLFRLSLLFVEDWDWRNRTPDQSEDIASWPQLSSSWSWNDTASSIWLDWLSRPYFWAFKILFWQTRRPADFDANTMPQTQLNNQQHKFQPFHWDLIIKQGTMIHRQGVARPYRTRQSTNRSTNTTSIYYLKHPIPVRMRWSSWIRIHLTIDSEGAYSSRTLQNKTINQTFHIAFKFNNQTRGSVRFEWSSCAGVECRIQFTFDNSRR